MTSDQKCIIANLVSCPAHHLFIASFITIKVIVVIVVIGRRFAATLLPRLFGANPR